MREIPYNKPYISGKELEYIEQAVLVNEHLSGNGPFTKQCERWLTKNLGCRRALLTHSCTAALEMAAHLCNIQPGDEVIMPSFTFVSTANAFVLRNAVPVFIDIRPDTLNLDETKIEQAVTEKTKAIVPVHYAGVSCNMDVIQKIADRFNLWIVEDAAQGLHSRYKQSYLGTIGHLGCLSFHETKNVISGEGGALLVNDPQLIERAEIIREKGTNRAQFFRGQIDKYTWVDVGSSYLPSELVGAFLFAQLEQAQKILSARCHAFNRYMKSLNYLETQGKLRLPSPSIEDECNGHLFYIITQSLDQRTRLIKFLGQRNILAVFHFVPLHSSPAGRTYGRTSGDLSVTDDMSERILRLPLYYEMEDRDIDQVVEAIGDFYAQESV